MRCKYGYYMMTQSYVFKRCMNNTYMILGEIYRTDSSVVAKQWFDHVREYGDVKIIEKFLSKFDLSKCSVNVHNCVARETKDLVDDKTWNNFISSMARYYTRQNIPFSGILIEFQQKRNENGRTSN